MYLSKTHTSTVCTHTNRRVHTHILLEINAKIALNFVGKFLHTKEILLSSFDKNEKRIDRSFKKKKKYSKKFILCSYYFFYKFLLTLTNFKSMFVPFIFCLQKFVPFFLIFVTFFLLFLFLFFF